MNRLRQTLRRIFPPPRRPLTWKSGIPLAVFLVLFASTCLTLYFRNRIDFVRPWMFLLLLVTPWIWWMQAAGYSGLPRFRGGLASFIRLLIAGLLIVVLAEPRAVRTSDVVSVVYDVDVSDSVNEAKDQALSIVAGSAAERPPKDEAGLVVFGRNAAVEYPPRETFPFEKFINSQVGQDATNLEQSLALSSAMLPEEHTGRVVLISDGTETVGQLKDVIDDLQSRNIEVDVVPIEYEFDREVLLERLDLPRFVRLGETYDTSVVLTSLKPGSGTLVLEQNDKVIERMPVEFQAGKNRFSVPILVAAPGYYEYRARIEVPTTEDTRVENNEVQNYLFIEGPGRVLVVTDPQDDPQEWQYFVQALQQGEREVEVKTAIEFPLDPLSLMPYDAIVFCDVPADTLSSTQIQAVHDAVRNLGIGFLMLGGPNSFGPGGYQNSPIEDALPISMEISKKKILPKGALVIILHTCEFPQGNSWAKRITKEAIRVLNAEDEVGAIGYGNSGEYWIFELTPASDYNSLVTKINAAQIGDMPSFDTTMELGLVGLQKSDAATRHMIIISDGDPPMPPPAVVQKFRDTETTISTVAIFPHGPRDAQTLNAIASATGGRFYYPPDPAQLPSIFIKEAKTLRRSQVQKRTFTPIRVNDDPIIRGITATPPLHGYVLTSEKEDPRATILLAAPPKEGDAVADDSDVDPILAVWRYGLGATAAFTSDMTNDWGRDWLGWDQFQQMVTQLMTRISRVRREQFLRVYTYTNGNEGVIVVEDFHPEESLLDVTVTVTGPDNFNVSKPVRQIAPRRYQVSVPLHGQGRYQVQVAAVGADRRETAYGGFIVSYSPEYLRFRANPIVLRDIATRTGGRELEADANGEELAKQIYGDRKPKRSSTSIFDWFLMTLACLVPLDVAVRRVQVDVGWVKHLFRKGKKESTETMGALLQRTESVRSTLVGQKDSDRPRPAISERPVVPRPVLPKPVQKTEGQQSSKPQASEAPSTPASDDGSTTSRLLAMKKKRAEEDKEG
ncbi:MAG: VWA domain-containing protein [Planctomycetaceae bacterium]